MAKAVAAGGHVVMLASHHCRSEAERYAMLAQRAKSRVEQDRHLRMKRSYELMARSADFDMALGELLDQLKAQGPRGALPAMPTVLSRALCCAAL